MKLVETEIESPADEAEPTGPMPPRPERRRVMVSLFVTIGVLVGAYAVVYTVFPARHNHILDVAIDAHRAREAYELVRPSRAELDAWGDELLGRDDAPWPPTGDGVELIGARSMQILRRNAVFLRYEVDGVPVSLLVQKARDAPPRKHRRVDGDAVAVSWRSGAWTMVAVGPEASYDRWAPKLGAP